MKEGSFLPVFACFPSFSPACSRLLWLRHSCAVNLLLQDPDIDWRQAALQECSCSGSRLGLLRHPVSWTWQLQDSWSFHHCWTPQTTAYKSLYYIPNAYSFIPSILFLSTLITLSILFLMHRWPVQGQAEAMHAFQIRLLAALSTPS